MNNDIFREPTKGEINDVVKKTKSKMKKQTLNIAQLGRLLDVNYPNLTRVLNGKLVNMPILKKLNEWINE